MTPIVIVGVTRADMKHCAKLPDAREELNSSVREYNLGTLLSGGKGRDQGHMTLDQK